MRPARGKVLVKRVETEETLPGGRIIFTDAAREAWAQWQIEVIAIGEPPWCQEPKGDCLRPGAVHQHTRLPGDTSLLGEGPSVHLGDTRLTPSAWCIIRHRSLVPLGSDDKRFLCNQEDILGVFQEGGAVITQTGQSHVMSMERRHELAEREIDRRAAERYGDGNYK